MNTFGPSHDVLLRAIMRRDLCAFVVKVFQTVRPGDPYVHNWHIEAITLELMEIHWGKNRRLAITQPPRSLKSICVSVAYLAWALGHDPTMRFGCVSYSHGLAGELMQMFRMVVASDWYRRLFPNVGFSKNTEDECITTQGGGRVAVTIDGSLTGRGFDVIVIDDPIKAEDARSDNLRPAVNEWFRTTLVSRLNDKEKGAIILVMQRLHEDDLAGTVLKDGGWKHLDLPAIAQEDRDIPIGDRAVYRWRTGEPLQAKREPLAVLERIKRDMGSLPFSAQFLQRPVPHEGNLIKREWIRFEETPPERGPGTQVIQSWDVASTTTDGAAHSVCTTWLMVKRNYHLLDVWRGRLEFPFLKRRLIVLASKYAPNRILIEKPGPGLNLIQELRANPVSGVPMPIGIKPEGDKKMRMEAQAARFESGQVNLPKDAPWLGEFLHEILAFPNSRYSDQVDSVSQFLNWAETYRAWQPTLAIGGIQVFCG